MAPASSRIQGIPISVMVMSSFVLIILIPLVVYSVANYINAWGNAEREIEEKHGLLAKNLALPLHAYLEKHEQMMAMLADRVSDNKDKIELPHLLEDALIFYAGVDSISIYFLDNENYSNFMIGAKQTPNGPIQVNFENIDPKGQHIDIDGLFDNDPNRNLSGVILSPFSNKPALFIRTISERLVDGWIIVLAELDISPIEDFRSTIRFGKRGHSAIVDHRGNVVAHPSRAWAREMKNLSDWPIIQKIMAKESGVTEYYSSFLKEEMVAGYTYVPKYGWGIMVPQPKSEISDQVLEIIKTDLLWAFGGCLAALILAYWLTGWLVRPLNSLAQNAQMLHNKSEFHGIKLSRPPGAPREVDQLYNSINTLIEDLYNTRRQIVSIVNHSPLLFVVFDKNGHILFAAGNVLKEFNIDLEHDNHVEKIIGDAQAKALIKSLKRGEEWSASLKHNNLLLELWATSLHSNDRASQLILVGTDVSATKLAEDNADLLQVNRRLLQRSLNAVEAERERLARELHDQLGQDLVATRSYTMLIHTEIDAIFEQIPEKLRNKVTLVRDYGQAIEDIIVGLQSVIHSMLERLWPEAIDTTGLEGAVEDMIADFQKQHPTIRCNLDIDINEIRSENQQLIFVYRILQECLTNIAKHANASRVTISLYCEEDTQQPNSIDDQPIDTLILNVADNGRGFNLEKSGARRHGIVGMRERVLMVGGQFSIETRPGKGCHVTAVIPIRNTHPTKQPIDIFRRAPI